METLKILFVTSKFPRFEGDAQPRFVFDLAEELHKLGHEINIICPHDFKAKEKDIISGILVYRFKYFYPTRFQKIAYGAGIPANLRSSLLAKLQIPLFALSEILLTKKIAKKINPDIVHAHWGFPQGLAAKLTGRPYIVTIYGGEVFLSKRYHLLWLLDYIIKNSCGTFALTNGLRDVMKEFSIKSKVGVIPLGVNINKFHPDVEGYREVRKRFCKENELLVLSVARLVEKKGIKYLIEAFAKVLKKIPDCRLAIIGDGPLRNSLIDLAKTLKISDKVKFVGEVNHKELPKYYCAADLFVLPSIIDSTGDRETQGVVFLEAMASKLAVMGTNTGGIPDIISNPEVGVLVPQKDSEKLAEKMIELLSDKDLRNRYKENAYEHVIKNFTWKDIAKRYVREYEKCLG